MKNTNIITHLAAAAITTIILAAVYATVQQAHRSGANDPQLQIAGDIGHKIKNEDIVSKWFSGDTIDISQSLSSFTALYNDKGEPVASTGLLNGRMPSLPKGVFDVANKNGENVFTWQPQTGVRVAVVLQSLRSSSYSFVAVGRSLVEVEKREENLRWIVLISWLLCIGVIMFHWIIIFVKARSHANR